MPPSKSCIIGMGSAGLLALFSLSFTKVAPEDIVCIDPYHDGGDLQRKWAQVQSNTIWNQLLAILRSKDISLDSLPSQWKDLDPSRPTYLANYIGVLKYSTKSYRERCELVYGTAESIVEEGGLHRITTSSSESFLASCVLVTTGSEPKTLGYPIPTIPLEIGLDLHRLRTYVKSTDTVLVFGTSHSGTLVLSNLHTLGATVYAFHKGTKPFQFARDGEYDGIKQESEAIADTILAGSYPRTILTPVTNTAELLRRSRKADWVLYATGFQQGSFAKKFSYDSKTGRLNGLPAAWGFGIAFPSLAEDGIHLDVSIPAFYAHIERQLPTILNSFYA